MLIITFPSIIGMLVSNMYRLMSVALVYSIGVACISYVIGVWNDVGCRTSGSWFYDWFMGYARVVRIGDFDLKLWCEARPGLQLWIVFDYLLMVDCFQRIGGVDYYMFLVFFMQWSYIADYFWFEDAILVCYIYVCCV